MLSESPIDAPYSRYGVGTLYVHVHNQFFVAHSIRVSITSSCSNAYEPSICRRARRPGPRVVLLASFRPRESATRPSQRPPAPWPGIPRAPSGARTFRSRSSLALDRDDEISSANDRCARLRRASEPRDFPNRLSSESAVCGVLEAGSTYRCQSYTMACASSSAAPWPSDDVSQKRWFDHLRDAESSDPAFDLHAPYIKVRPGVFGVGTLWQHR